MQTSEYGGLEYQTFDDKCSSLPEFVEYEFVTLLKSKTITENSFGELKFESTDYRVYLTEEQHPVLIQKRINGYWQDYLFVDRGCNFYEA